MPVPSLKSILYVPLCIFRDTTELENRACFNGHSTSTAGQNQFYYQGQGEVHKKIHKKKFTKEKNIKTIY